MQTIRFPNPNPRTSPAGVSGSFNANNQGFSGSVGGAPLSGGKLSADQISFSVGATQYSGRVSGDSIEGSFKSSAGGGAWKATRAK